MDTNECQPLYLDIQEFYEGLNMKIEQQVPLLLVERQALNEAMEGEKNVRSIVIKLNFMLKRTIYQNNNDNNIIVYSGDHRIIIIYQKPEAFVYPRNRQLALYVLYIYFTSKYFFPSRKKYDCL